MNILPKKRWHVRTKDNIARVRRDEAAAAEEERKRQHRIETAEKEARVELLRAKARETYGVPLTIKKEETKLELKSSNKHINLFFELEENGKASDKTNSDHEREKKEEREKEEMKIGYLTYLGQDTNELSGAVSWYNKLPTRAKVESEEVGIKQKALEDPLKNIRSYLDTDGVKKLTEVKTPKISKEKNYKTRNLKKKHKEKRKKSKKSKSDRNRKPSFDLEKLREERLKREQVERKRAEEALAQMRGESAETEKPLSESIVSQKYNSQFNPHLARQNFL